MAQLIPMFLKEMEQEAVTTRKMLERVPAEKFSWQPHPKSMTLQRLATHVAELPGWVSMTINTSELDFANNNYKPKVVSSIPELLEYFETGLANAKADLEKTNEEALNELWTLRNDDKIFSVRPKHEVIRMSFCQTVHHRAQLGVFLRLLDVPIPGSYGPSADEHEM
ncbi:MAG TPA: DinB family protein [Chitinophagaceae bacterium]|nr:DinB family protein [Chitinophagaceae bacterium]